MSDRPTAGRPLPSDQPLTDELEHADRALIAAAQGTNAVAALQAGHPFSLLLADDERRLNTALDLLLDNVADPATRFARVTNPLRARLTLERLLIQVIQGGPDLLHRDVPTLVRQIAERRATETRVILVVERAETLHPEVLRFFGEAAPWFPDGSPRLQILFVGRPEFRAMLDDPETGMDEQTALLEQYRPVQPEKSFGPGDDMAFDTLPQRPPPFIDTSLRTQVKSVWSKGLGTRITILGAVLVGIGAVSFGGYLAFSTPPNPATLESVSALAEMPEPGADDPDPPVLQPGAPPDAATAQLRSEFESYLIAAGKELAGTSSAQKRLLLQEFMLWKTRTQGPK